MPLAYGEGESGYDLHDAKCKANFRRLTKAEASECVSA